MPTDHPKDRIAPAEQHVVELENTPEFQLHAHHLRALLRTGEWAVPVRGAPDFIALSRLGE